MIDVKKLRIFNKGIYANSAVPGLNCNSLRITKDGSPWWAQGGTQEIIVSGNVKRILKVDWPYVKTIINVEG